MIRKTSLFVGLLLSAALSFGAFAEGDATTDPAQAIVGVWQPPDKLADYEIRICDPASGSICLRVLTLRGKAIKPENTVYLGKDIVDRARPAGTGAWKGKLRLWGQEADGTVKVQDANTLKLTGCAYIVVCKDIVLTRFDEAATQAKVGDLQSVAAQ